MRAQWLCFHVIRTLFSVPALAIYLLAVMSHTSYQQQDPEKFLNGTGQLLARPKVFVMQRR